MVIITNNYNMNSKRLAFSDHARSFPSKSDTLEYRGPI